MGYSIKQLQNGKYALVKKKTGEKEPKKETPESLAVKALSSRLESEKK